MTAAHTVAHVRAKRTPGNSEISSPPLRESWGPSATNSYNLAIPRGYADTSYKKFVGSTDYEARGQVYVGANDGMFHAFKLGTLLQKWSGRQWYQSAKLEGAAATGGIGTENWAFIPKNVLPYLQYLSDPDYAHVYTVDGPITLFDASINPVTCINDYWNCAKQTTLDESDSDGDGDTNDIVTSSWRSPCHWKHGHRRCNQLDDQYKPHHHTVDGRWNPGWLVLLFRH